MDEFDVVVSQPTLFDQLSDWQYFRGNFRSEFGDLFYNSSEIVTIEFTTRYYTPPKMEPVAWLKDGF